MNHRLRDQSVLERSTLLVERAGAMAKPFRRRLVKRLLKARLPGLSISIDDVRTGGWFSPARPLVVARLARHRDLRCYVGAEAAGVHLEVMRYVAAEPFWLKRAIAGQVLAGAWWGWSLPRGMRQDEEVGTFLALIDSCVSDVTKDCAARVAAGSNAITGGGSVLDRWQ